MSLSELVRDWILGDLTSYLAVQFAGLNTKLNKLLRMEETQVGTMQDLVGAIGEQTTVVSSVETMVDGVVAKIQELRDLIAAGGDPELIDALIAELTSDKTRLAEAVAEGTAAASEVPTP